MRYKNGRLLFWVLTAAVLAYTMFSLLRATSDGRGHDARGGFIVLVLAMVILPGLLYLAARGQLVSVRVVDDTVIVTALGNKRFLALRRQVTFPRQQISGVRIADFRTIPLGLKMPGTAIPGVITAGSYGSGAQRTFCLVRKGRQAVVIDLHACEYARVIVEVPNPEAVVAELTGRPAQPAQAQE